ncbi:unnamed protein product [Aphanomyces euteiches]
MTAADRISAFASILTRPTTDHPPGVGLRGIENNQDAMVHDIFPLHDPNVNDFITSSWFKEALSTSTRRLFLLRTKDHFGLQIAFYMAFVRLYCSALSTPCVVGILLWIIWRQAHYWSYMQALGIFGLLVAFVWAPSVLKRWKRYQHALLVEWDLIQAKEVEYPNHQFKNYVVETINVASEGDTPDYVDIKTRYWVSGLVAMDSAFVTPLIVTQALNLLINTFVPYLLRRAVIRARDAYLVKKDELSLKLKNGLNKPAQNVVDLNQNASKESAIRLGELQLQTSSKTEKDAKEMKLHLVATSGQNDFDLTELEKEELALHLAEKRPIRAADLESTAVYLFGNLSRHHNQMSRICSNIRREELDEYQVTSYDWIDRVTQDIAHNKKHENIWEDSLHKTKNQPSFRLRLIKDWHCRKYIYNADRIIEESSMSVYSPQGDLLHMAIQFSYVTMFSVIWPFCALCAYCNNAVATRFDTIKMVIDCKRAVPRRVVGIGPWFGAFMLETLVATMVVPAIFVYVTGQMDAFSSTCTISETNYGPVTNCYSPIYRLIAFCLLENIGIGICFFVYLRKKDISRETSIKMQEHSRRVKYSVRKSVRTIGEHILVDVNEGEWRQGTVAWVQNGRVKVNFHTNEGFGEVSHSIEHEAWLDKERYVLEAPIPVRIFDMGMPVLLASAKKGIWLEGNIVGLDLVNRSGKELAYSPNEMHLSILEGRNLKSYMLRNVLDPYCVVTCGTFKHMTTIKRHTLNPLWNEYLVFTMTKKDMNASNGKLRLSVYNHDALSLGECIGEAEIDMSDHINGQRTKLLVPLLLKKNGLNVELLGNAVHKLALGDDCFEPQLLIEIQWIDSRFPAQVQVKVKQDGEEVMPRVLTRKQCETRLCYGFHSHEIKEGRIYDSNIAQ